MKIFFPVELKNFLNPLKQKRGHIEQKMVSGENWGQKNEEWKWRMNEEPFKIKKRKLFQKKLKKKVKKNTNFVKIWNQKKMFPHGFGQPSGVLGCN